MSELPAGTVTFLFTDIEGSTKLWETYPDAMRPALAQHDRLLYAAIAAHGGRVFKTIGDAFCAAFATAPAALAAALEAQLALLTEAWAEPIRIRARMALHTGAAEPRDDDYFGPPLNRVARLLAAGHGGQTLLTLPTQELSRDSLSPAVTLHDMGLHRLRDLARPEQVFQLRHPALPDDFPPLRSLDNPEFPNNLPQQVTSFIGREREIDAITTLFATTRLLTLTGSGGCGKTRLALQVAADALENYPEGVWLVELAPLSEPALVPQTVAAVLDVKEQPGKSFTDALVEALKPRQTLLVLDNCEHLLTACAGLAASLLRACPGLKIFATSRQGLGIAGEQTFRVPSLSLPDPKQINTPGGLTQYEAVRLFIERAALGKASFAVTNENAPAVAQLCYRLDGIPLAIELAAARIRALSVEEINARLDSRFRLLTGGDRAALPRQQTLRALIDWSYDLLSQSEMTLLRRQSAFAGGWTLAASEQVCAGGGDAGTDGGEPVSIEDWEVFDLLTSLVDKSLVIADTLAGETRYRLLESVRQYAADRLTERADGQAVRRLHRDFYLRLAETAAPALNGPEQAAWLERLETEHDNLRLALHDSLDPSAPQSDLSIAPDEFALRFCGALHWFWYMRGYWSEGRAWCEQALALASGPTVARADALDTLGTLVLYQGDHALARASYEEKLAIYRAQEDQAGIGSALHSLAHVAHLQGDYAVARPLYEEALAMRRAAQQWDGVSQTLNNLANVAMDLHEYAPSRSLHEEALAMRREAGDVKSIAQSLQNLGCLALQEGRYAEARPLLQENLALIGALQERRSVALTLEDFALLAAREGKYEQAARLWGASEALREALGASVQPHEHERREEAAATREIADAPVFDLAWAAGRALTYEQAIEYALAL